MKIYVEVDEDEVADVLAHGFRETFDPSGAVGVAVSAEPGLLIQSDPSVWVQVDIPDDQAQRPAPQAQHWLVPAYALNRFGSRRVWKDREVDGGNQ